MKPSPRMCGGFVVGLTLVLAVVAGEPDDDYVRLYRQWQQANGLLEDGQADEARREFLAVQEALLRMRTNYPAWNPQVVEFRLRELAQKLVALPAQATLGDAQSKAPTELDLLRQGIQDLERERDVLQAKLREALAARPAAVDPLELAKAEERIKAQQEEIERLKTGLKKDDQPTDTSANREGNESAQQALARAWRELAAQGDRMEKEALRRELASARVDRMTLEAEIRTLRVDLAEARQQLDRARAAPVRTVSANTDPDRLRALEQERNELRLQLDGITRELLAVRMSAGSADPTMLTDPMTPLPSRSAVPEPRRVPFPAEEPRPLQPSDARRPPERGGRPPGSPTHGGDAPATPGAARHAPTSASPSESPTVSSPAPGEVPSKLAALTATARGQIDREEFSEAEHTLQSALAGSPQDASCLSLLGQVQFRQDKLDDALGALSRSAQLNPTDAETFAYLGLVLSRKGLRQAAEAALWRAVQLAPSNRTAHYHLAVLYAAEQPPLVELARFHYQKAVAAGRTPDASFERRLAELPPSNR
jgi:tetratricopeptide (TPR) repeat protein